MTANIWVEHGGRWHRVTKSRGGVLVLEPFEIRCGLAIAFAWHVYVVDDEAGDDATPCIGEVCETCSPLPEGLRL